jgi:hypothetical protein
MQISDLGLKMNNQKTFSFIVTRDEKDKKERRKQNE